jgi:hypothetical protein
VKKVRRVCLSLSRSVARTQTEGGRKTDEKPPLDLQCFHFITGEVSPKREEIKN